MLALSQHSQSAQVRPRCTARHIIAQDTIGQPFCLTVRIEFPCACVHVNEPAVLTGAEAYACFLAVQMLDSTQPAQQIVRVLAGFQIVFNVIGGMWAYPPMIYKALKGPVSKTKTE